MHKSSLPKQVQRFSDRLINYDALYHIYPKSIIIYSLSLWWDWRNSVSRRRRNWLFCDLQQLQPDKFLRGRDIINTTTVTKASKNKNVITTFNSSSTTATISKRDRTLIVGGQKVPNEHQHVYPWFFSWNAFAWFAKSAHASFEVIFIDASRSTSKCCKTTCCFFLLLLFWLFSSLMDCPNPMVDDHWPVFGK